VGVEHVVVEVVVPEHEYEADDDVQGTQDELEMYVPYGQVDSW